MDDVLVGSRVFCCSCIFVFICACYPVPLSLVSVHSLPCSRVAQICRKTVRTWISLSKSRNGLDDQKDQRQTPRRAGSGVRRGRSGGRRDSGWRNRGLGCARKSRSSSSSSSSSSQSRRKRKQQRVKEAQKLLEKHDPAELLAKVVKDPFDQTMSALSPISHHATAVPTQSAWCYKFTPCC